MEKEIKDKSKALIYVGDLLFYLITYFIGKKYQSIHKKA
jgi:hypothetical protein